MVRPDWLMHGVSMPVSYNIPGSDTGARSLTISNIQPFCHTNLKLWSLSKEANAPPSTSLVNVGRMSHAYNGISFQMSPSLMYRQVSEIFIFLNLPWNNNNTCFILTRALQNNLWWARSRCLGTGRPFSDTAISPLWFLQLPGTFLYDWQCHNLATKIKW